MNPFFSIIVPTYNRVHTLGRCIDSVIIQTYDDWELIIVDDGSSDGTDDLIKAYTDTRIRYVWQENQERSAARNHGVSLAKGEWICFQDSDDEYLPNHLEVLHQGIKENPLYKVLRTGLIIKEEGKPDIKTSIVISKYDCVPYECFTVGAFHRSIFSVYSFDTRFYVSEDLHFLLKVGQSYSIKLLDYWTGIYHYEGSQILFKNESTFTSARSCFDDILKWNKTLVLPYIELNRCVIEMKHLQWVFKNDKAKLGGSIMKNIQVLFRYPIPFFKAVSNYILR